MKVTNISSTTIYLRDLKFVAQAQTEGRRGEDRYIAAGKDGKFKAPAARHESAVQFATEDAALDQAEALGLHLDTIRVMTVRKAD